MSLPRHSFFTSFLLNKPGRMKTNFFQIMILGLAILFAACDSKKTEDSTDVAEDQNEAKHDDSLEKDSKRVVELADGGLYEVQLATMAVTKATSAEVKKFAQMMVDDHTKVNNELKAWAGKNSVTLPDVMSEEKQKKYYDLESDKEVAKFDEKFMDEMVEDHKKDIKKFEDVADDSENAELKSWAAEKLSTLRHHLSEAERIHDLVKKNGK
jgi:putative membrane protein